MAVKALRASELASEIAKQLSTRSRHVVLFLGAGAPHSAGLPDMAALKASVLAALDEDEKRHFDGRDVEAGLSRLRRLSSLIEDGEQIEGLTLEAVRQIDEKACTAIIAALDVTAKMDAFEAMGAWAAGASYDRPTEIVTVNYDLLIERALDRQSVPYFDGFVGTLRANFREDLVEPTGSGMPSFVTRLWKIHGSVNWEYEERDGFRHVVRVGSGKADRAAAIYPSDEKYDESRRVPFVVLMDRFRRSLAEKETLAFFTGYSFKDQHLNEILYDAARRHPRNHFVCFSFSDIPDALGNHAMAEPNITVIGKTHYISGGQRNAFENEDGVVHNVWNDNHCLLPDFSSFARFLQGSKGHISAPET